MGFVNSLVVDQPSFSASASVDLDNTNKGRDDDGTGGSVAFIFTGIPMSDLQVNGQTFPVHVGMSLSQIARGIGSSQALEQVLTALDKTVQAGEKVFFSTLDQMTWLTASALNGKSMMHKKKCDLSRWFSTTL